MSDSTGSEWEGSRPTRDDWIAALVLGLPRGLVWGGAIVLGIALSWAINRE